MDDEAAFLEAIRAEPDDATRRLIYADWLQENEDPPDRAGYLERPSLLRDGTQAEVWSGFGNDVAV